MKPKNCTNVFPGHFVKMSNIKNELTNEKLSIAIRQCFGEKGKINSSTVKKTAAFVIWFPFYNVSEKDEEKIRPNTSFNGIFHCLLLKTNGTKKAAAKPEPQIQFKRLMNNDTIFVSPSIILQIYYDGIDIIIIVIRGFATAQSKKGTTTLVGANLSNTVIETRMYGDIHVQYNRASKQ